MVVRARAMVLAMVRAPLPLVVVAVAQTPDGLTGSVLRVGSKNPKVVARPRRALLGLGAPSAFHGRHSERSLGSRRRLYATASVHSESEPSVVGDFRFDDKGAARWAADPRAESVELIEKQQREDLLCRVRGQERAKGSSWSSCEGGCESAGF